MSLKIFNRKKFKPKTFQYIEDSFFVNDQIFKNYGSLSINSTDSRRDFVQIWNLFKIKLSTQNNNSVEKTPKINISKHKLDYSILLMSKGIDSGKVTREFASTKVGKGYLELLSNQIPIIAINRSSLFQNLFLYNPNIPKTKLKIWSNLTYKGYLSSFLLKISF